MTCGIYCIENTINGKRYVGQSRNILERKYQHKYQLLNNKDSIHLQRAVNEYGYNKFIFYTLETCTLDMLNDLEIKWIILFKTVERDFGYNLDTGGGNKKEISEETRLRMSNSALGKILTEKTKKKMSEIHVGILHPNFGKKIGITTSKFLGVAYHKRDKKWRSYIKVNSKQISIGAFKEELDAAKAYDKYVIDNNLSNPTNFKEEKEIQNEQTI